MTLHEFERCHNDLEDRGSIIRHGFSVALILFSVEVDEKGTSTPLITDKNSIANLLIL